MKEIEALRQQCGGCFKCSVARPNCHVFSSMNIDANVMLVGQSPGEEEIDAGIPFLGSGSDCLMQEIQYICGLSRSSIYMTNVVKCMPKGRRPKRRDLQQCRHFLDKEIALVNPDLIIAAGALPFKVLTGMSGIEKHYGEIAYSPRYNVEVLPIMAPNRNLFDSDERVGELRTALQMVKSQLDKIERG